MTTKTLDLIRRLTDGRRDAMGSCLVSKKQSLWLSDVLTRETGKRVPCQVGDFDLVYCSRFKRNRNQGVIRVMHLPTAEEFTRKSRGED